MKYVRWVILGILIGAVLAMMVICGIVPIFKY